MGRALSKTSWNNIQQNIEKENTSIEHNSGELRKEHDKKKRVKSNPQSVDYFNVHESW